VLQKAKKRKIRLEIKVIIGSLRLFKALMLLGFYFLILRQKKMLMAMY